MSQSKSTGVTRRQFLQRIAAVGGYAATYQAMAGLGLLTTQSGCGTETLALTEGNGTQVIILGAGIAGMSAAYEMSKRGYNCKIIEARNRAGGRNETARHGTTLHEIDSVQTCNFDNDPGLYANLGPARLPHHHRNVLRYCKEFNIPLEMFSNDNRAAFFHDSKVLNGQPIQAKQLYADSRGALAELFAKTIKKHALDEDMSADDQEKLLAYLKNFGDLNAQHQYVGSSRAGFKDTVHATMTPGVLQTPLDFKQVLTSEFWDYKMHFAEGTEQAATMFQPVGGMDKIVDGFYARISGFVELETEVLAIRNTMSGVEVDCSNLQTGDTKTLEAKFCICTIPTTVLRNIPNNFDVNIKTAIAGVTYEKSGKAAFQSTRFWEEQGIYGGISWTDQDITQMWYPASDFHQAQGIIVGAYVWDEAQCVRFANQTPDERLEACKRQGEAIHAGYSRMVKHGITRSWHKMKYQQGAWRTDLPEIPEILHHAIGQVYLAGEHMSMLPGWQEGAIISAQKVMTEISNRISV